MNDPFQLVQVCNVGTLTGGTGACARTILQALPDWSHTLLSFGPISREIRTVCQPHQLRQISNLSRQPLQELNPDLLILHNSRRDRVEDECLRWPAIYYQHSNGPLWDQIKHVACSHWLAAQREDPQKCEVLHQAVPRPPRPHRFRGRAALNQNLTVGRLCTPVERKWPAELMPFYKTLASQHPTVRWEFAGCPDRLQAGLREAVGGRAVFHEACWQARTHFWNWDILLYHHPTLTESFGRTVAEAMRTGCIPVVDDRGGFREQLPVDTGYLCGALDEFSSAVSALSDPAERMRRSRRCRAHADDLFSIHAFRERLLELFRRVTCD